jgi:UDP:flavonoid glycosyltransferase YjiC (YdhE family)
MRVLFSSLAGISHVLPLAPIAWAFRAAGHEVLLTFAEHTERASLTGLQVVDVAPGYDGMGILEKALESNPEFAEKWWSETLTDDPAPWALLFAELNRPFVERTMALADDWKPDLVVYEQSATVGLMAAARLGIPAVQRNLGIVRTGGVHEATAAHMQDLCDQYGITSVPKPTVTLEFMPPSMLPFAQPEGWFVRHLTYTGGAVLGERLEKRPDRPRIAVTMGTARPGYYGLQAVEPIVAAAADVDAEFVLALGDIDASELGTLPPNVRLIGWTPMDALLRTCSGIVHHGGGGTTMAAIDAGVPQLLALDPLDRGNETTGPAVRKRGVGIVTTYDRVEAETLNRLLTDTALRTATAEVQAEIAELPTPAELVPRLLELR